MRMDYKGLTTEEADGIRKQVAQARRKRGRILLAIDNLSLDLPCAEFERKLNALHEDLKAVPIDIEFFMQTCDMREAHFRERMAAIDARHAMAWGPRILPADMTAQRAEIKG